MSIKQGSFFQLTWFKVLSGCCRFVNDAIKGSGEASGGSQMIKWVDKTGGLVHLLETSSVVFTSAVFTRRDFPITNKDTPSVNVRSGRSFLSREGRASKQLLL